MTKRNLIIALASLTLCTDAWSQAALEWTGGQTNNNNCCYTLGWRFRVSSAADLQVRALGAYDELGNGLATAHVIGIWPASGGGPIALANVPAGVDTYHEGHFRWVNINPVTLFRNSEYVVAASDYGGDFDAYAYGVQGVTTAPGVTWLAPRETNTVGLVFPRTESPGLGTGLFGANFRLNTVPSVARATIRLSEVEVCWTSENGLRYQVQYQSVLTTNQWQNLGAPITATGAETCYPDRVHFNEPQRYYRIIGAD